MPNFDVINRTGDNPAIFRVRFSRDDFGTFGRRRLYSFNFELDPTLSV